VNSRNRRIRVVLAAGIAAAACCSGPRRRSPTPQLTSTEPVAGTALAKAPDRVVLRFGEAVEIPLGSSGVRLAVGKQIETAPEATHADGQSARRR